MNTDKNIVHSFINSWSENRHRNHILFWIGNTTLFMIFEFIYGNQLQEAFLEKLIYLPSQLIGSYALAYYIAPKFIEGKYLNAFLSFGFVTYIICVLARFLVVYVLEPIVAPDMIKDSITDILTNMGAIIGQYFLLVYITPIFFLLLKYGKDTYINSKKIQEVAMRKKQIEINFLKAQVHPHFLFNTLNNIYSLAVQNNPQTSKTVKQLGDIMEYMLESTHRESIPIKEEITLLQNYIDLEKIRYGDRLQLNVKKDIINPSAEIAPLMLMSFVENAFKHGVSGNLKNPKIDLEIVCDHEQIHFSLFNTKTTKPADDLRSYKKGIGVTNVKRQLELLYKDHHSLDIINKENTYSIHLTIPSTLPEYD